MRRYALIIMVVLCMASGAADGKGKLAEAVGRLPQAMQNILLIATASVIVGAPFLAFNYFVEVERLPMPGNIPLGASYHVSWRHGSANRNVVEASSVEQAAERSTSDVYELQPPSSSAYKPYKKAQVKIWRSYGNVYELHTGDVYELQPLGQLPSSSAYKTTSEVIIRGRDAEEPPYMLASVETRITRGTYEVMVWDWLGETQGPITHLDEPYLRTVTSVGRYDDDIVGFQLSDNPHIGSVVHLPNEGSEDRLPFSSVLTMSTPPNNCCDGEQDIFHIPLSLVGGDLLLPSESKDIAYLEGKILSVYNNGLAAIGLDAKFDAEGNEEPYGDDNVVLYVLTDLHW